jgi:hypothetical protein
MRQKTVKSMPVVPVTVGLAGDIVQCSPASAYVYPGQAIEWNCDSRFAIAVHLGYDSPFVPVQKRAGRGVPLGLHTAEDTPCGRYKYVVAISDGDNVWIEDPEIIVRR